MDDLYQKTIELLDNNKEKMKDQDYKELVESIALIRMNIKDKKMYHVNVAIPSFDNQGFLEKWIINSYHIPLTQKDFRDIEINHTIKVKRLIERYIMIIHQNESLNLSCEFLPVVKIRECICSTGQDCYRS